MSGCAEEIERQDDVILELLIMVDKLTDSGDVPDDRQRFGEIVHELFGSWQAFDATAYGHMEE